MGYVLINESILSSIGNILRSKLDVSSTFTPIEFNSAIMDIDTIWIDVKEHKSDYIYDPTSSLLSSPIYKYTSCIISIPNCSYIGNDIFSGCINLSSMSIPNCSYIGNSAFYSCWNLSSIFIPNCSYIGSDAFQGCSNLSSINIPNCSYIGSSAFYCCSNLSSISIPNCSYIGSYAFTSCSKLTNSNIQEILDNYKSYSTVINDGVFYSCYGITSLDLTGYTSIGGSAFRECSSLYSANIPNCSYIGSF